MNAATTTAPRFYAARAEGRYRVIDGNLIDARADGDAPGSAYVAVCASRAKAEEKAAKLNAEHAADAELDATREFAVEATSILTGAPEVKPLPERPITQNTLAAVEAETKAYRIGKVLREWILANDADSDLAAHIASRNVCYDGTATLRVTAKWAQELSWLATDLENAAVKGDARIAATAKAPSIMAARAARKTLSNLF